MKTEELKKLKELAQAATPGPWDIVESDGNMDEAYCCWHDVGPFNVPGEDVTADDRFISAANPAAVSWLVDEVLRLSTPVAAPSEGAQEVKCSRCGGNNVFCGHCYGMGIEPRKIVGYGDCKCVLSKYCDGKCNPIWADHGTGTAPTAAADGEEKVRRAVVEAVRKLEEFDRTKIVGHVGIAYTKLLAAQEALAATPSEAAPAGQSGAVAAVGALTDEKIIELHDSMFPAISWDRAIAQNIVKFARAVLAASAPAAAGVPDAMPKPDEMKQVEGEPLESFYRRIVYANGWNACREAMLYTAPASEPVKGDGSMYEAMSRAADPAAHDAVLAEIAQIAEPVKADAQAADGSPELRYTLDHIIVCYPWHAKSAVTLHRVANQRDWIKCDGKGNMRPLNEWENNLVNSAVAATSSRLRAATQPAGGELAEDAARLALQHWIECWEAAEVEGLADALHDAKNVRSPAAERLADLIERRIAHGVEPARAALKQQGGE